MNDFVNKLFSHVDSSWRPFLAGSVLNDMTFLNNLAQEYLHHPCYPDVADILKVFSYPLAKVKVVILGQDPYHTKGVADGLAFSSKAEKVPPSLGNIFSEIASDVNISNTNPNLSKWAEQGVFLLNTKLSVIEGRPNSHQNLGWERLIKPLLSYLDMRKLIFVLWGNNAKAYEPLIKHSYVITGAHPSPFSYQLFKGGSYFSRVNELLLKQQKTIIDWSTD